MPTYDQNGNILSLEGGTNTPQAGSKGFIKPAAPVNPGVDRYGPAWLDPKKSKQGDWKLEGGEFRATGQNPLWGPAGTVAGSTSATSGDASYQGTGGGVPNALQAAPGVPQASTGPRAAAASVNALQGGLRQGPLAPGSNDAGSMFGGAQGPAGPIKQTAGPLASNNGVPAGASSVASPGITENQDQPATGPGAGRGYASNFMPGQPMDTTFATDPNTGASFETSPMYQWQQKQGEKAINRQARARGRYNSSAALNALQSFNNNLGAAEADKQYNRTFDQQKLGLTAALAEAQAAGNAGSQQGQLIQALGTAMANGNTDQANSIMKLLGIFTEGETNNANKTAANTAQGAQWRATGNIPVNTATGTNDANTAAVLAKLGIGGVEEWLRSQGK